jgi:DNA-directed RNA polymerase specialized sigma24 family protein
MLPRPSRQEWAYPLHLDLNAGADRCECATDSVRLAADAHDAVAAALTKLEECDQKLIGRLYSNGQTEAEVAKDFGMNQGTISRSAGARRQFFSTCAVRYGP